MAGVYIHIPFCKQACHYCNFHFATSLKHKDEMVAAIIKEIKLTPHFNNKKTPVNTIYFGGGTPSILDIGSIQSVLQALHKKFTIANDAEVTLEANPDDITLLKLKEWKQAGVNRLSVGIQSFNDAELQWMNRTHSATESLQCIDNIKDAGFTNFSVDLIYGSPLLSNDDWKKNVQTVIKKDIPHISCYALTVEPRTALDKLIALHKKQDVDSDKQAEQFLLLMKWMKAAGYRHYEISNFAKPGLQSRHNSSYWSGENYYGFGPSAHSFNGKSRRWNIASNTIYLLKLQEGIIPAEEEILTPVQQLNEYIMTALRKDEGISLKHVTHSFSPQHTQELIKQSSKWKKGGKLIVENEHLILTNQGKLFADGIAADFFFSDAASS
jgi:oxygen-independent coproporphyrinogen III oxidase